MAEVLVFTIEDVQLPEIASILLKILHKSPSIAWWSSTFPIGQIVLVSCWRWPPIAPNHRVAAAQNRPELLQMITCLTKALGSEASGLQPGWCVLWWTAKISSEYLRLRKLEWGTSKTQPSAPILSARLIVPSSIIVCQICCHVFIVGRYKYFHIYMSQFHAKYLAHFSQSCQLFHVSFYPV